MSSNRFLNQGLKKNYCWITDLVELNPCWIFVFKKNRLL